METIICPKCNQVLVVPQGKDFVLCCGEVIYVLTGQNRDIFFNELTNPSEPNEALKKKLHHGIKSKLMKFTVEKLKNKLEFAEGKTVISLNGYAFIDECGGCIIIVYGEGRRDGMSEVSEDGDVLHIKYKIMPL